MPNVLETDLERAAELFHALSDTTRLEIVRLLSEGERCVCELTATLDAAQSRLSFHLKVLKDAGLVNDRREGRWVYYSLDPERCESLGRIVGELGLSQRRDRESAGRRLRVKGCCD